MRKYLLCQHRSKVSNLQVWTTGSKQFTQWCGLFSNVPSLSCKSIAFNEIKPSGDSGSATAAWYASWAATKAFITAFMMSESACEQKICFWHLSSQRFAPELSWPAIDGVSLLFNDAHTTWWCLREDTVLWLGLKKKTARKRSSTWATMAN